MAFSHHSQEIHRLYEALLRRLQALDGMAERDRQAEMRHMQMARREINGLLLDLVNKQTPAAVKGTGIAASTVKQMLFSIYDRNDLVVLCEKISVTPPERSIRDIVSEELRGVVNTLLEIRRDETDRTDAPLVELWDGLQASPAVDIKSSPEYVSLFHALSLKVMVASEKLSPSNRELAADVAKRLTDRWERDGLLRGWNPSLLGLSGFVYVCVRTALRHELQSRSRAAARTVELSTASDADNQFSDRWQTTQSSYMRRRELAEIKRAILSNMNADAQNGFCVDAFLGPAKGVREMSVRPIHVKIASLLLEADADDQLTVRALEQLTGDKKDKNRDHLAVSLAYLQTHPFADDLQDLLRPAEKSLERWTWTSRGET